MLHAAVVIVVTSASAAPRAAVPRNLTSIRSYHRPRRAQNTKGRDRAEALRGTLAAMRKPVLEHRSRLPAGLVLGLALVLGVACGGSPVDPADARGVGACAARDLPACETALVRAIASGDPVGPVTRAYAAARREADPGDGFAATLEAADAAKKQAPAALGVEAGAEAPASDLPRFEAHAFEPVGGARRDLLVLAIAETAGLDELALAGKRGPVVRAFGADPMLPLVAGLPATIVGAEAGALATDAAVERSVREAVRAARVFDYVAASQAVDELDALVEKRPRWDGATVRARVLLSALDLSAPRSLLGEDDAPAPGPAPAPAEAETAYVDVLRVRTDPASANAYEARRAHILKELPAELATSMEVLYGAPADACALGLPPSFARERDLAFVGLLPRALRASRTRDAAGRLPLEAWYASYGAAASLVEKTRTAWLYAPSLLLERGASSNLVPTGTETHRRVTELALKHEKALTRLAEERPGRVGLSRLAFLVARGHYDDAPLRSTALDLARLIAQGTLANATDAWEVLAAATIGVFYGIALPGELAETHFTALQGAFTAKLRGDLSTQTGWGVAAAYAIDGGYRSLLDLAPSPKRTVTEITRALETDPAIAQPGLASLVSALVRYGALAADGQLGTPILASSDTPLPGRAEARAALARALAKLSDGPPPPKAAIDELTSLLDGAAATLALATLAPADPLAKPAPKPATQGPACEADTPHALDPRVRRAVGKLADLRRRVWTSPALAADGSAFNARARLALLVVSDAVDVAQAVAEAPTKKPTSASASPFDDLPKTKFFVSEAEARAVLAAALKSYGSDGHGAKAIGSSYALTRGFLREGRDHLVGEGRKSARALLEATAGLLDDGDAAIGASELLRALGRSMDAASPGGVPVFVAVARELYGRGQGIEADMVLLSAAAVAAVGSDGVPAEATELAATNKSDVAAALAFLRESQSMFDAGKFNPSAFAPGLDALAEKRCVGARAGGAVEAYAAMARWRAGERDAGRLALDAWLDRAPTEVTIPRYSFQFKQETRTRVVALTLDIGLGRGLLTGTNALNAGIAAKSPSDALLTLDVSVASPDSKRTRDDTARFYVHAAATAGVYHFLAGDDERGEQAAMRALAATTRRTELYVMGVTDEPPTFAKDAGPTLAILAQLAAEHGRPLLAGSLWSVLRATQTSTTTTVADLEGILDVPAPAIDGAPGVDAVAKRARATLRDLAAGLPCAGPKLDQARLMSTSCQAYPQAVGLRVADALAGLPRLKPGPRGEAGACPDLAALDAFLGTMQAGRYEPDRLIAATRGLIDAGKTFDATLLLTQQREPGHCSREVLALLHDAAAHTKGVPAFRADLLGGAVNCNKGNISAEMLADLDGFATEIARLGDPMRELELALFATELTLTSNDVRPISLVVRRDGYLARGRDAGPLLLGIGLLLDHAASTLAHEPVRLSATQVDYDLLCGTMPRDDRAQLCGLISSLRKDTGDPDARAKTARSALERVMTIPK